MKNYLKATFLGLITSAMLSGCADIPNHDLANESRHQVHSIAFIGAAEPNRFAAANLGGALMAFGAIGGAIQAISNQSNAEHYLKQVSDGHVLFAPTYNDALTQSLSAQGFAVTTVPLSEVNSATTSPMDIVADGGKPLESKDFTDYSALHVQADAIMRTWFTAVGYVSLPNSIHYTPVVLLRARLINAANKQELYDKTYSCGWELKRASVYIPADPSFAYSKISDLLGDQFTPSTEGIRNCERAIASAIGHDLNQPHD